MSGGFASTSWLIFEPWWFTTDQSLCVRPVVTINELPDDVLLEIFSFYLDHQRNSEGAWHALVHVCRRWRCLVFASPRRLHLRLLFTYESPVKEALDVWPELPIAIQAYKFEPCESRMQILVANVIAALKQHDRVCEIHLAGYPQSLLKIFSAMKKPFPSLVDLTIMTNPNNKAMIPNSFLGGSAPRLQSIALRGILCPAIVELLLSTRNLVFLSLARIPPSGRGYTSPEAMVDGLSVLTKLRSLHLTFHWHSNTPQSQQANGHQLPIARAVLPALTDIYFLGDKEYLGDFVRRIDTPLLANITIGFIHQSVSITPPLSDFISRRETFGVCSKIDIGSSGDRAKIDFFRRDGDED